VNADSTLIQPGRILISGSTTLDDWRYGNSTMIDGGDIYAGTITAQQVTLAPHNMVANASFEIGSGSYIPGWIRNQLNPIISTVAHTGSQSIAVTANGGINFDVARQDFLVSAGDAFYFEGWMRQSGSPPGDAKSGYTVRWLDSGETILRSDWFTWTSRYTWSKRGGVLIAPANAVKVSIYLDVRDSCDANTTVYWDDVVFMRASSVGLHVYDPAEAGGYIRIVPEEIAGYDSVGSKQFYLKSSNGRAMFGGGKGVLDEDGLVLSGNETSYSTYNAVRWMTETDPPGGNEVGRVSSGLFYSGSTPGLFVTANPNGTYALSLLEASARNNGYYSANVSLYGAGTATLRAQGSAGVVQVNLVGGSNSIELLTGGGAGQVLVDSAGNVSTTGQVNRVYPHIILPSQTGSTKTSTASYQIATFAWQSFHTVFNAIAGRGTTSQTNWQFYWIVTAKFPNNPTKLTFKIVHYTGSGWTDLRTTTIERYAAGLNMIAIGPASLTSLTQTMRVEFKHEGTNPGQIVGEADGGVSALLFVRS